MARHSAASFAIKLFALGSAFLYAVMAARLLGPRGYGLIVIGISVASIASTVALLGIDGLAVRESAKLSTRNKLGEFRRFVRWSTTRTLCTSFAAAILVAAISPFARPYQHVLLIAAVAVPLLSSLSLLRGITQGTGRVVVAQIPLEIVRWLATLALIGTFMFGFVQPSPEGIVAANVAAFAAAVAVALALLRLNVAPGVIHQRHSVPNTWLRDALPFLQVALFAIAGTEISTLLLGTLSGPEEAGLYQPVAKLSPLMLLANEAIDVALAPRIVGLWQSGSKQDLARLLRRSAVASTVSTAAVAGAIVIASPLILGAFGPEFLRYRGFLYAIATAQILNAALGASPLLLAMTGDMKRKVRAQIITLVVQAGLGLMLVPVFGAVGAVISLVVAILTWAILHWWFAWRATGIDTAAVAIFRLSNE